MPDDGAAALSAGQLARIARIAEASAGLVIAPGKAVMVGSRLAVRLRDLSLESYADYLALVESDAGGEERRRMVAALTTNVTHFFREAHHFETLRDRVLPPLIRRAQAGGRVRIWSAGCATGQEPYSIATTIAACLPGAARLDIRILATDLDPGCLAIARRGHYDDAAVAAVPAALRATGFAAAGPGEVAVKDDVRDLVRFQELNLVGPWPMRGGFDAIFCRNVVIYFSAATQAGLWPRFADRLAQDGWLFVGHAERVPGGGSAFVTAGITTYRRARAADGPVAEAAGGEAAGSAAAGVRRGSRDGAAAWR